MSNDPNGGGHDHSNDMGTVGEKDYQHGIKKDQKKEVAEKIAEESERYKKEKEFVTMGKTERSPFMILNLGLDAFNKGSVHTRQMFKDKVLSKKGVTYDGTKYSKTEFEDLDLEKQNEIYEDFLENRMTGKTDAYGNPIQGWRRENIKHTDKHGNVTTKVVWQGGPDENDPAPTRLTEQQIEAESAAEMKKSEKEEKEEAAITEEEYKKRRGLKGSRSMFGHAGGRGYFDPA
tara:strand:+ start:1698 stop:2393 length:696 start_codon:yes stop_codon:yes gene_type:complete